MILYLSSRLLRPARSPDPPRSFQYGVRYAVPHWQRCSLSIRLSTLVRSSVVNRCFLFVALLLNVERATAIIFYKCLH